MRRYSHRTFSCISCFSNCKRTIEKNYISICPKAVQFRSVSTSPALGQPSRARFGEACPWFCPRTRPECGQQRPGPVLGREGGRTEHRGVLPGCQVKPVPWRLARDVSCPRLAVFYVHHGGGSAFCVLASSQTVPPSRFPLPI